MKNNWILISLFSSVIGGVITFLLTNNWKVSLLSAVLIFIIAVLNNPKRRYIKAFWVILSMILILNKFFFEAIGTISDTHFKVGSNEVGNSVSIALIFLASICLLLDYLERNGKLDSTIFSSKKNTIGNITGNNNRINQSND